MNQFELMKKIKNKDVFDSKVYEETLADTSAIYTVPTGKYFKPHRLKAKNFSNIPAVDGGNDSFAKYVYHFDGDLNDVAVGASVAHNLVNVGAVLENPPGGAKFGSTALHLKAGGIFWAYAPSSVPDLSFGTDDFTIDFWIYAPFGGIPAGDNMISHPGSFHFWFSSSGIRFAEDGGVLDLIAAPIQNPGVNTDAWHHVAIVRQGTTVKGYFNGALNDTGTCNASFNNSTPSTELRFSYQYLSCNYYLDEVRISKGIARWTAPFTPPTSPYGASTPEVPRPTKLYFDMQNGANPSMRLAEMPISATDVEIDFATDMKESGASIDGFTTLVPLSDIKCHENEILTLSTDSGETDFTIEGTLYKQE